MKIVTIPCSFDNYSYLIICPDTGKCAVVDPTEAYPVMAAIEKNNASLTTILCTHHHHDHTGDIKELLREFPELEVVCHISDKQRIREANTYVDDGDRVKVGTLAGRVIYTPGHTTGSVCYHFAGHLFSGDTLFGAGCGRLFEGSPEQMFVSLNSGIAALADDTRIYFGHEYTRKNLAFALTVEPENDQARKRLRDLEGNEDSSTPTTLALEKQTNPFLRTDSPEIQDFAEKRMGQKLDDPVRIFALLRSLRNDF